MNKPYIWRNIRSSMAVGYLLATDAPLSIFPNLADATTVQS